MSKLIAFITCMVLTTAMAIAAPLAPVPDPDHFDAVVELLLAAREPELQREVFIHNAVDAPDPKAYVRHVSDDTLARLLAAAYAPYVTPAQARQLAAAFSTPEARTAKRQELALFRTAFGGAMPKLTAREREDVKQFRATAAAADFAALGERSRQAVQARMGYLFDNNSLGLVIRGGQVRTAFLTAQREAAPGAEPLLFVHAPEGVPYVDQLNALFAQFSFEAAHAAWKANQGLAATGANRTLLPANLIDAGALASSRQAVAKLDGVLAIFERESDSAIKLAAATFAQIDMPAKALIEPALQHELALQRDGARRYMTYQRAVAAIMLRVFDLAESQLGRSRVAGGAYVLDDAAAMAKHRGMLAEIASEASRYKLFSEQAVKRLMDAGSGTIPPLVVPPPKPHN